MNTQMKVNKIQDIVSESLNENGMCVGLGNLTKEDTDYIIQMGTDILCTKWGIGITGGNFVQSVVDNNLKLTMLSADYINIKALKFYCQLIYETPMPEFN